MKREPKPGDCPSAPNVDEPDPDLLASMERSLAAMPRRAREIFVANRVDGLDYTAISEITGLSVRRVKRHMARALFRMMCDIERPRPRPRRGWRGFIAGLFR